MLSKAYRFHGRTSLRSVYTKGKTYRSPLLSLKQLRNEKRSQFRLAVVVSKKVASSAVVRNKIRRRIYELVRQEQINGPHDLVITVFSDNIATMPQDELRRTIIALFKKAGVIS